MDLLKENEFLRGRVCDLQEEILSNWQERENYSTHTHEKWIEKVRGGVPRYDTKVIMGHTEEICFRAFSEISASYYLGGYEFYFVPQLPWLSFLEIRKFGLTYNETPPLPPKDIRSAKEHVMGRRVDFAMVYRETNIIALLIEIDGAKHKTDEKTIQRDELLAAICGHIKYPLLRFSVEEIDRHSATLKKYFIKEMSEKFRLHSENTLTTVLRLRPRTTALPPPTPNLVSPSVPTVP